MTERVCDQCAERNGYGTTFCASCGAFLAWDEGERSGLERGNDEHGSAEVTVIRPPPQTLDPAAGLFRVAAEATGLTVAVTGEPSTLGVRITNTSTIVEGFLVEALDAPSWLVVDASEVRLLPDTEELVTVSLRVASGPTVPAQQVHVGLRLRPVSQPSAYADLGVVVTVPVVDGPVVLRAEPRLLRLRDCTTAECVVVASSGSNRPVRLRFAGSDPELAVTFAFTPPVLELGPGDSGSVRLEVTAPAPEPGQEAARILTVTGTDGSQSTETTITLQQATTARIDDAPVVLEAEPSLVRVRDTTVGQLRILADNRGGREWAHLWLKAGDPERLVRVTWAQGQLHVPPGRIAYADARLEAPLPDPGTEVSRTVTITATDGRRTSTTTAMFVQGASASAMETLTVRVDPSVVRVRDADGATVQVVIDNRRGRSGVRVALAGADPERVLGFSFAAPVVDVGPGQVRAFPLGVGSARPQPGQEQTRPFTVTATAGDSSVEASGTLVQSASRSPMESLVVRLDPTVLRLRNRRRGTVGVILDNRRGTQPVQVRMSGDDPENALRFVFTPALLTVAAGATAPTLATVRAPSPAAGPEVTRPFVIVAADAWTQVQSEGSIIASASSRRPLARMLCTLLGALAMVAGSFQTWLVASSRRGVDLDAGRIAGAFGAKFDLGGFERLLSAGLVISALGVLVLFGLAGASGRLSRGAAVLGVLVLVALFVALGLVGIDVTPDLGALLVIAGCVAGYVGGALRPAARGHRVG